MPSRLFLLFVMMLFSGLPASAQVRWMIYAGAGTSHNWFRNNARDAYLDYYKYQGKDGFDVLPLAGVSMFVPIGKHLLFETGINYTAKQYRASEEKALQAASSYQLNVYNEFKTRMHYLGVPFTLSYKLPLSGKSNLYFGGGINYGFLLAASERVYSVQSTPNAAPDEYRFDKRVPIGLVQTRFTPSGALNIFDTGIKLQLSYEWNTKLMLRLFHEYSLYSIYLKEDLNKPDVQLRYSGISIGYLF